MYRLRFKSSLFFKHNSYYYNIYYIVIGILPDTWVLSTFSLDTVLLFILYNHIYNSPPGYSWSPGGLYLHYTLRPFISKFLGTISIGIFYIYAIDVCIILTAASTIIQKHFPKKFTFYDLWLIVILNPLKDNQNVFINPIYM